MTDRMYRRFERPLMVVAWVLYLIYFPMAVADSGEVDWWPLVGSCFWLAHDLDVALHQVACGSASSTTAMTGLDYRAAARCSMRPRLMVPSYWFWWAMLRVPGERAVEYVESKVWPRRR